MERLGYDLNPRGNAAKSNNLFHQLKLFEGTMVVEEVDLSNTNFLH
tara:strand:+ start:583 stop:720 length:138 start_codon:yes stop_codon:yes gene_type:complete